jgi:hypothetical protein
LPETERGAHAELDGAESQLSALHGTQLVFELRPRAAGDAHVARQPAHVAVRRMMVVDVGVARRAGAVPDPHVHPMPYAERKRARRRPIGNQRMRGPRDPAVGKRGEPQRDCGGRE